MQFHGQMYIIGDSKYEKNEKEQQVESYQTVYRGGMGEIIEKKSRFIAEVYPIESEEQAAQILEETEKKILGCKTSLLGICSWKKSSC